MWHDIKKHTSCAVGADACVSVCATQRACGGNIAPKFFSKLYKYGNVMSSLPTCTLLGHTNTDCSCCAQHDLRSWQYVSGCLWTLSACWSGLGFVCGDGDFLAFCKFNANTNEQPLRELFVDAGAHVRDAVHLSGTQHLWQSAEMR